MTELDILREEHRLAGEAYGWIDAAKDKANTDTLNYLSGVWDLAAALIHILNRPEEVKADGD